MDLLDPVSRSVEGLLVLEVDPGSFQLVSRLDARRARWTPAGWDLTDGVVREVGRVGAPVSRPFARLLVAMPEHIDDFTRVHKPPEAMSFAELRAYVARLRDSGHQVEKYVVDLHGKLSFPLVHAVLALVAIPFALVSPRAGGRAAGFAVAFMIAAGYWVVHSAALAFARADLLPPLLAAWTANVVFGGLGAALLLRART
jgi:lipopolysaccharide export system permease protein